MTSQSGVRGRNAKVADTDIQGQRAGKRSRTEDDPRAKNSPDREGLPSEFPASKAGIHRDKQ